MTVKLAILIGERASQLFRFARFQPGGQGMDEDLAGQWIDPPRLTPISTGARSAGDVACKRPHGGIGSVGPDEADAVSDKETGSRHQGEGTSHTRAEQAASDRVHVRSLK